MRSRATFAILATMAAAFEAAAQVRPATITSVAPTGVQRGTTVTLTVEGANLAGTRSIQFSDPRITAEIRNVIELPFQPVVRPRGFTGAPIEDLFALHRLLVRVAIPEELPPGRYNFRVKTPLGATNLGSITVGTLVEIGEAEPNNSAAEVHRVFAQSTLVGTIARSGDEDFFELDVEEGKTLVFEVQASALGSALDAEIALFDAQSNVLARNNDWNGRVDSFLAYTFPKAGSYRLRVTDATGAGSARHFYRINLGALTYITRSFPLGVRAGAPAEIELDGYNLPQGGKITVAAPSKSPEGEPIELRPKVRGRESLSMIRLAAGRHASVSEREPNDAPASAQAIELPVTIDGRIEAGATGADRDTFRFRARKGERVSIAVEAQRLGSPLDSILEITDAAGKVVPRAVARPVWQTFVTLNDPDSVRTGIRIDSWSALQIGDTMMIGNELVQVNELPKNPDDDIKLRGFRGARLGYEGTTPEAHSMNSPVYKIELHKPGSTFPPNGMPSFTIPYANDDGGQMFGKDSYLMFEAPADGDYFVRIRDIRSLGGHEFAYRLTLQEPRPDFTLSFDPKNPNLPRGAAIPLTVTAARLEGFDGAIDVELADLPAGITADPARILPGSYTTTIVLRAAADARDPGWASFRLRGRAEIAGELREHWGETSNPRDDSVATISVVDPPELLVTSVEPRELVLEPGGSGAVTVKIERRRGFAGRVPVEVRNLPQGVIVPDIGLNGILITEDESSRSFHVAVDPRTGALEQTLYLVARIETNGGGVEHASVPIRLKVLSKKTQVSQK